MNSVPLHVHRCVHVEVAIGKFVHFHTLYQFLSRNKQCIHVKKCIIHWYNTKLRIRYVDNDMLLIRILIGQ